MSFHNTIYETTNGLHVHRARISVNGSTGMSAPDDIGIYNLFRTKTNRKFMASFGLIILTGYTGAWNHSASMLFTVRSCTAPATTGKASGPDGTTFSSGTTIFYMNAVTFNAGSSGSGITGQIGCAVTSQNVIDGDWYINPGSYILLRNSSVSLVADVTTIDVIIKGYYLDI